MIRKQKRLSAKLNETIFQCVISCRILTHADYAEYSAPVTGRLAAGTHPARRTRGGQAASLITAGTKAEAFCTRRHLQEQNQSVAHYLGSRKARLPQKRSLRRSAIKHTLQVRKRQEKRHREAQEGQQTAAQCRQSLTLPDLHIKAVYAAAKGNCKGGEFVC